MFSQLKATYSLGFGGALWRTLGLLLSAAPGAIAVTTFSRGRRFTKSATTG